MRQPPDELRAVFTEARLGEQLLVAWWATPHPKLEDQAPHDWLWALRNGTDRLVALAREDTGLETDAAGPSRAPAAAPHHASCEGGATCWSTV